MPVVLRVCPISTGYSGRSQACRRGITGGSLGDHGRKYALTHPIFGLPPVFTDLDRYTFLSGHEWEIKHELTRGTLTGA